MPPQCAHRNESPHCAYLCGSTSSSSQRSPPSASIIHVIDSGLDSCLLLCCMSRVERDGKHPGIKTLRGVFSPRRRCSRVWILQQVFHRNVFLFLFLFFSMKSVIPTFLFHRGWPSFPWCHLLFQDWCCFLCYIGFNSMARRENGNFIVWGSQKRLGLRQLNPAHEKLHCDVVKGGQSWCFLSGFGCRCAEQQSPELL